MPLSSFFVIPVKTGIQSSQYVLDTRLRGYDEQTGFINRLYLVPNRYWAALTNPIGPVIIVFPPGEA
jgi:hypothetical protein